MSGLDGVRARYLEGRLLPFIGSGVSRAVEWESGSKRGLSWSELVDQAAVQLGFDDPELLHLRGNHLQILEYYREKKGHFTELRDWFLKEMSPPSDALSSSVLLDAITSMDKCRTMYTTNYDDFLERALVLKGKSVTSISREEDLLQEFNMLDGHSIVKFHGDLKHPETMVLSEEDYDKRMRFDAVQDHRLQSDVLGRAILFIGYSFSDYNVSYLFRKVQQANGPLPESQDEYRAYIILPAPSDFEDRLFRARRIKVIRTDTRDITASTAALIREISGG